METLFIISIVVLVAFVGFVGFIIFKMYKKPKNKIRLPNYNRPCFKCKNRKSEAVTNHICIKHVRKFNDLVSGLEKEDGFIRCSHERTNQNEQHCGPDGKFFERNDVAYTEICPNGDKYEICPNGDIYLDGDKYELCFNGDIYLNDVKIAYVCAGGTKFVKDEVSPKEAKVVSGELSVTWGLHRDEMIKEAKDLRDRIYKENPNKEADGTEKEEKPPKKPYENRKKVVNLRKDIKTVGKYGKGKK